MIDSYTVHGVLLAKRLTFNVDQDVRPIMQGGRRMDRQQDAENSGETDNISYADRGADNPDDLTRYDENSMDRAAQSGTTGAFGTGDATDSEQRRQDAEAAFGGTAESGGEQNAGSATGTTVGETSGGGVSLGDVAGGSSDAAGERADDELAGGPGTGGGGGTSSAGVGG